MIVTPKVTVPGANVYTEEFENFMGTQVALMESESVHNRVNARLQADPTLHPSPVESHVTLSPKSSIFNLQAIGKDAAYTQAYLKSTMEEFINLKREMEQNEISSTEEGLDAKIKHLQSEIQRGKDELLNYQGSNNLIFLQPGGGNSAAEYLANLRRQLDDRKSELKLLQTLDLDQNLEHLRELALQAPKNNPPAKSQTNTGPAPTNVGAAGQGDSLPANLGTLEDHYLETKRLLRIAYAQRQATLSLNSNLAPNASGLQDINKEIAQKEIELDSYKDQAEEQLHHHQHVLEVQIPGA